MAKLKNPLLSFDAHGSLGNGLSFRRHAGATVAEKKPRIPYFLTLPVQYQRWLYQDYAYLWTQQTSATKQVYNTSGSRHHLTGFQYWMKYHLTWLPDITGLWHLDEPSGALALDSSRNSNNGIITGATPTIGPIAGAYSFDGDNDHIELPVASIFPKPPWALELFFNLHAFGTFVPEKYPSLFFWATMWTAGLWLYWHMGETNLRLRFYGVSGVSWPFYPTTLNKPTHVVINLASDKRTVSAIVDGVSYGQLTADADFIPSLINPRLNGFGDHLDGSLDNVIIYNRNLSLTEALRHSLRRWPAK